MTIVKKLLIAATVLVIAVLAAVVIAGFFIPSQRSFGNEIVIDAPAEAVWNVITDKRRYTEWQTQLDRVEIVDDANWIEYPKDSPEPLRFTLAKDDRPSMMEFTYSMGDAMNGRWVGEITPTANGVRLKTIDSYKTDSWLMKILIEAFFDLDGFAKDWNNNLKRRVETLK